MKILKTSLYVCCAGVMLLISGCASTPTVDSASFANSRWHYMDDQWEYDITFLENGKLSTTHPNDKTPENDSWEQTGETVKFYFNNKFSNYEGKIVGQNLMTGTAKNTKNKTWNWKATRMN